MGTQIKGATPPYPYLENRQRREHTTGRKREDSETGWGEKPSMKGGGCLSAGKEKNQRKKKKLMRIPSRLKKQKKKKNS